MAILKALSLPSPSISCEFLYDDRGSELYTQIVEQKEYYLPAAEKKLLQEHQESIARIDPSASEVRQVVIELGAGDGHKTLPLVDCIARQSADTLYVPCDISPAALEWNHKSFQEMFQNRAGLNIQLSVGTHEQSLAEAACLEGRRTYMFMGSSIGNMARDEILSFFELVGSRMSTQDRFLLGVDRAHGKHKPVSQLEAAYNDAAGVTAAFTLNGLSCVNRVAGLDFKEDCWQHVAKYDEKSCYIMTHVEAVEPQALHNEHGQLIRSFQKGDQIFMERSGKFELPQILSMAKESGLVVSRHWSSDEYMIVELRRDFYAQWLSRSRQLFMELIGEANLHKRPIDLRNPYIFYLGHNPAFADIKQLKLGGSAPEYYRKHFERGIDPDVDDPSNVHSHSELLEKMPSASELNNYEERVCNTLKEQWLQKGGTYSEEGIMNIEHAMMHHETLLYMVAEDPDASLPLNFIVHESEPPQAIDNFVAGGRIQLGASKADQSNLGFVWDNEAPACEVSVSDFLVRSHPITNAQFQCFVEDKGYTDAKYWASPGECQWAQKALHGKPLRWQWSDSDQDALLVRTPFSGLVDMSVAAHWPAHVTLAEAMAYCRWLGNGARVMREEEYHMIFDAAAKDTGHGQPLTRSSAYRRSALNGNNNFKHMSPTIVGSMDDAPSDMMPVFDLVGNGWEWSSSEFVPFPGFQPMPSYPEYSTDFFDGKHFVCLGASMFTNLQLTRPSFRNFFQGRYPYVIAKFRLVWDA